jgi:methylmalonyl-CoA/ethylmalonyl-CoA epimerase
MLTRVHHINFIVEDLEDGIRRFQAILGRPPERTDTLAARGAITATFQLGETALVLVQPTRADSTPGRHLAEHGEGFFLLSLETDDLAAEASRIDASGVVGMAMTEPRHGIKNWRVMDLQSDDTWGAQLQLVQEGD